MPQWKHCTSRITISPLLYMGRCAEVPLFLHTLSAIERKWTCPSEHTAGITSLPMAISFGPKTTDRSIG
jgi:hypothetical protein